MIVFASFFAAVVEILSPPIIQILLWGSLTFWTFTYTLLRYLSTEENNSYDEYHVWASALMSVFWGTNLIMWFASTIKWMLFTDLFFVLISVLIFNINRKRWSLTLALLYTISFGLDIALWWGMSHWTYAWLSNIVYAGQLFVVSGWVTWNTDVRLPTIRWTKTKLLS